jgi:hypothetical protein
MSFIADCLEHISRGRAGGGGSEDGEAVGGPAANAVNADDGGATGHAAGGKERTEERTDGQRAARPRTRDLLPAFIGGMVTMVEQSTLKKSVTGQTCGGGGRVDTNTDTGKEIFKTPLPPALECLRGSCRLRVARLGAMGHSFGAATCMSTCASDPRFVVCVSHDPWLFPLSADVATGTPAAPTMHLLADTFDYLWPAEGRKCLHGHRKKAAAMVPPVPLHLLHVKGTRHQNFSDFPLLAPTFCRAMGSISDTDADEAMAAINALTKSFMVRYLHPESLTVAGEWAGEGVAVKAGGESEGGEWTLPEIWRERVAIWQGLEAVEVRWCVGVEALVRGLFLQARISWAHAHLRVATAVPRLR